jgi:hypothetical protein
VLRTVHAVLPLQGSVAALLTRVTALVEAWPEDIDGALLVPTRTLTEQERTELCQLEGSCHILPCPSGTLGQLVQAAVADLTPADAVVLLAEHGPLDLEALRSPFSAASLQGNVLLGLAVDHRSLLALQPVPAENPCAAPDPLTARTSSTTGAVSAIVSAGADPVALKACLEHLRRGGPRTLEVAVVDLGTSREVTRWLAGRHDVLRFATAAVALQQVHGDTVLVLDAGTLLPRNWAEGMRLGEGLVAVGPVAHGLRGQQHDPTAVYSDRLQLQERAAQRRRDHGRELQLTDHLAAQPLLARRAALLRVGGSAAHLSTQGLQQIATGVLAHVEPLQDRGSWPSLSPAPLLTAALIVKDEQDALPACLASLRGVVDEVVVCDTGSTDATVAIATAFGARLVHAEWDDDFAAARNTALQACGGTWVLSIDADEQLVVDDVPALRGALGRSSDDALRLPVRSRADHGAGAYEHHAPRLLRRGAVEWVGAVHEVPVRTGSGEGVDTPAMPGIRLDHDGYLEAVRAARGKGDRNLRLAEKDLDRTPEGDPRRWKATYELARTLGVSPATATRVRSLTHECLALSAPRHFRGGALVLLAGAELTLDNPPAAEAAAREAVELSPETPSPSLALATVLESTGRVGEALDVLLAWRTTGMDPAKERQLQQSVERLRPTESPYTVEARDPLAGLEKWTSLPQTTAARVGQARCLLSLGRLHEAAGALDGIDVDELRPDERVVVATVAAAAGDRATAERLLQETGPLPPDLAAETVEVARILRLLDALPGQVKEAATSA